MNIRIFEYSDIRISSEMNEYSLIRISDSSYSFPILPVDDRVLEAYEIRF